MRRGVCVSAARSFAAACLIVGAFLTAAPVRADDDDDVARFILFSGRDIWRNGIFAHGGVIYAPGGFEDDGLLFKVLLSGGVYRYFSGATGERIYGVENTVQVLPGWRVKRGDFEAKVFMGPDLERHWLWPDDPSNNLRGRSRGLRVAAEFWYEPTPSTLAAMDFTMATASASAYLRVAVGRRVIDEQFYFGPEIALFGTDRYRQFRVGGHFTAMKTGNMEWTAAGGWALDSDRQSSPYVRLNMSQKM